MHNFTFPQLAEGELYIGATGDAAGNLYHIVLLPGDNDYAIWQDQMEWAKSIGGDLPTRIEQAMLWANHRDQFKQDTYWSNESHHTQPDSAWFQNFYVGCQSGRPEYYELRARAVRRIPF